MENSYLHKEPHACTIGELTSVLGADSRRGLSGQEAGNRIHRFGMNKLDDTRGYSSWKILLRQFKSPIVGLLFFAAGLSFYFEETLDSLAILIVVFVNTAIGFYMEFQAERSMNALKKLTAARAKVLRDSTLREIDAVDIVPGDIVYVEAGDMVPADGRIFNASQLQSDESVLTGESLPSEKQDTVLPLQTQLAERTNMLYKGTFINRGNSYLLVSATGMKTELGKIATLVHTAEQSATPLEKKLEEFSKKLIRVTLILVLLIFIAGIINGQKTMEMLKTSIALAVAAIPEGLPIVATLALAKGMLKMARHQVIVKKLSAVETLGGTNVICADKTGTLTQNKIVVEKTVTPDNHALSAGIMNRISVLCNTAEFQETGGSVREIGDPLETALLKFAVENNINIHAFRTEFPKIKEEPFTSETKMMATLHKTEHGYSVYVKGAMEELVQRCTGILQSGVVLALDEVKKKYWIQQAEEMAGKGFRVIAGAYRDVKFIPDRLSEDLVFAGFFCMIDPPREEVFKAIEECKTAGIKVIMITGDHPATARNIALQLGVESNPDKEVMQGKDMEEYENLSAGDKERWLNTSVFARVSPQQKLDLVKLLQEKKYTVAMTGDGVNDAPALKKADIGVAMGLRGTQVSQEVADMILKDDSFSSIVLAIKQGRIIFDNIRKFVVYLLSCNLSELFIVATAATLNLHFQLLPLQILFINLITDVLPALALGVTRGGPDIMNRPPRIVNEAIIDSGRWKAIIFYSVVISAVSIGAVLLSHNTIHKAEGWEPVLCNNILFFTLIFSQLLHVFNMSGKSFFKSEVIRNKYVWWAIAFSLGIMFVFYSLHPVREVLFLHIMSFYDWAVVAAASITSLLVIQLAKTVKLIKQ